MRRTVRGMNNSSDRKEQVKKPLIPNSKERRRVSLSLVILVISASIIIFLIASNIFSPNLINFRTLRNLRGITGEVAAYGFGFSIAMYVIRRAIKVIDFKAFKPKIVAIARFTREWHAPISIIAFSIIMLHAYIMLSGGFIFSLTYVSGFSALLVLAVQMISGIFRYKRKGVKLHMVLGISFIVLMLIHLIS